MCGGKFKGIVEDISSQDYHSNKGTYSSSQLKDLLEDPEVFYRKYITKTQEKLSIPAFDVGTYFHTAILEPEKLKDECAVYTGFRRGREWEAFQETHKGKAIITSAESEQAEGIIRAVKNSPIAMNRISQGKPEISAFVTLYASDENLFSEDKKLILGRCGWEKANTTKFNKKNFVELPLKVRADLLGPDFILDLKSTTGNVKSEYAMRKKVSDYYYDLSAALYLDLFSLALEKSMKEFVWVFASKDLFNCKSYIASTENIKIGRAKYKKALITLANCISTNWAFEDSMGILGPSPWENEHLKLSDGDLL